MSEKTVPFRQPGKSAEEVLSEAQRLRDMLEKLRREISALLARMRELNQTLPKEK